VRALVAFASAVVLVDTVFYAAVVPLLPVYADDLGLGKTGAGVLEAAYAAGTLAAAIPAGLLAARIGVRPIVLAGLALLGGSSLVFGLAQSIVLLDVARFAQGVGGACTWAGAFAWLVRCTPAARRGAVLGTAMGAAIVGALLGPAVGAAAGAVGTGPAFAAAAVLAAALAAWATRIAPPPPLPAGDVSARVLFGAARDRPVVAAMLFVTAPGVLFGTIGVLGPLRLDELGAGTAAIGVVFLAAAALEAITSPVVGSLSDRLGRLAPMRAGLLAAVPVLLLLAVPESALLVALLVILASPAIGTCWAPAMALLADGMEARRVDPALGFSLMNAAWGLGHVAGGAGGGALGEAAGDGVAYGLLAAGCLALAALTRDARFGAPAPAPAAARVPVSAAGR